MKKFIIAILGSLLLFVAIYELTQIFQEIRYMPKGVDALVLVKKYFFDAIYWILMLQPFSFLFATVYVLSTLANSKELIAMISAGISIYRIAFYMIVFAVLYFILCLTFLEDNVFFQAYQQKSIYHKVIFQKVDIKSLDRLKDNHNFTIFGTDDLLYIVRYYNATSKILDMVTIVQYEKMGKDDKKFVEVMTNIKSWMDTNIALQEKQRELLDTQKVEIKLRIDAKQAVWDSKGKVWIFKNGTIRYVNKDAKSFVVEKFTQKSFPTIKDPPYFFEKSWYKVEGMTKAQAKKYVDKLKTTKQAYIGEEANYLVKFSYPFGVVLVVLTGIGILNLASRKISFIINFMLSLGLFILYYVIFVTGLALAGNGTLNAFWGANIGTIIFSIISLFLFVRAKT